MRVLAVLSLLAIGACEFVRPPTTIAPPPDEIVVHSMLSAGGDTVRVMLTLTGLSAPMSWMPRMVSGATVRIAGGGAEVVLSEAPAGFSGCLLPAHSWGTERPEPGPASAGCYAAVFPGGIRAGTRYTLEIDAPGGHQVFGETTVPQAPVWDGPDFEGPVALSWNGGAWSSATLRFRWRSAAAAQEVRSSLTERVFAGGREVDAHCGVMLLATDGSFIAPAAAVGRRESLDAQLQLFNCSERGNPAAPAVRPDSVAMQVSLVAYDTAYAVHLGHLGRTTVRETRVSPGLSGAYGVFGSVAVAPRRLILVPPAP